MSMKTHQELEQQIKSIEHHLHDVNNVINLMKKNDCNNIHLMKDVLTADAKNAKTELKKMQDKCKHENTQKEYHNDVVCLDCGLVVW